MKYTAKHYAQALMDAVEQAAPKDEEQILDNFVRILAENNDIRMFEQIAEEYHKLDLAKKGQKQIELTTARVMDKHTEQEILEQLNKLAKVKVEVKKKIDEELIGGIIIRMEDQQLDASVKNSLEELKNNLVE